MSGAVETIFQVITTLIDEVTDVVGEDAEALSSTGNGLILDSIEYNLTEFAPRGSASSK
jgi:hypothetical protein